MTVDVVVSYRIGWWTHRWWPTAGLLRCLVTGRQLSPRADNGSRQVPRRAVTRTIVRRLRLIRRPHRPWQAEAEGELRFCRRALTAAGAEAKMRHDLAHTAGLLTGYPIDSPWQLRRLARANAARVRKAQR
jgi:hypothetical protein